MGDAAALWLGGRLYPAGAGACRVAGRHDVTLGLGPPGGVTVGPDGYVYVTNLSVVPGAGHVLRFRP